MAFCKFCGTEIDDGAVFCHNCGAEVDKPQDAAAENEVYEGEVVTEETEEVIKEKPKKPKKHWGLRILGYLFPLVGLIMWLVWKDKEESREKGQAAGWGALAHVVSYASVSIIVPIILYFILKKEHPMVASAILFGFLAPFAIAAVSAIISIIGSILYAVINLVVMYAFSEYAGSMALMPLLLI